MARVAVVGGGLGGLSAAIHLATRGHDVVLYEKNAEPGGKAAWFEEAGYSFDTGPSLVTMPEVLDELYAAAGRDRSAELPLLRLDTQCRYFYADRSTFDVSDSRERTIAAIDAWSPGEGARFGAALDLAARLHDVAGRPFLERPFDGFGSFAGRIGTKALGLLPLLTFGSLSSVARDTLKDERLRWFLQRFATYSGGGPDRSPAALAMVLHVEHAGGAFYPPGGIARIPRALTRLAADLGVELRTGRAVDRIVVEQGRVVGVAAPQTERYDAVVSNADPVFVAERMLEPAVARAAGLHGLRRAELGMSGVVLMLGVRGELPQLAHHNVLFPERYADEFRDIFERAQAPEEPTVYLCVPSRTEGGRAPPGCESVFCMLNAPATGGRGAWRSQREGLVDRMLRQVERVVPDLRARIELQALLDPDDFAARFHAPSGSIYGVSSHGRTSPFHRPLARVEKLPGLYFAGGGTHPGGGIPLVLRSGKFAAELLEADLAKTRGRRREKVSA